MKTSDRGIAFLVGHEGVVPAPYFDSKRVLTYGIGHTAVAGAPDPASLPRGMPADLDGGLREAFAVFRRDLAKYEAEVARTLAGMPVAPHEFDAAVSFHFNTGAIATADWVKHWRSGNKVKAAEAMMNWRKPAEIIPRREAEQALFRDGIYGSKRAAVWPVDAAGKVTWKAIRSVSQSQILELLRPIASTPPRAAVGQFARLIQSFINFFKGA